MKRLIIVMLLGTPLFAVNAAAQDSAPRCSDFRPTSAALARFPDLVGACEAVVERNGELYGQFKAMVRRAGSRTVTLYLPATDRTFTVEPKSGARALIEGRKTRPRDLVRGQEISIYLSTSAFTAPDIEEIAFTSESDLLIDHAVEETSALPTTASLWPALGLTSALLLLAGVALRRRRLS